MDDRTNFAFGRWNVGCKMIWTKEQLAELDGRYRGRFINSISGVKPANLIATKSKDGLSNVALFSSVVHLGANPAMLGFVMRPPTVERHTWDNISKLKCTPSTWLRPNFQKKHIIALRGRNEATQNLGGAISKKPTTKIFMRLTWAIRR